MNGTIDSFPKGENLSVAPMPEKIISVAPMMDWTDRRCRYFHRLLSRHTRLYTEMVHAQAVLHNAEHLLRFDPIESPVALQLGGSTPDLLAQAARIGADFGYDEINLNCGCPSERVQEGRFGACLMAEPDLVARGIEAMIRAVPASLPVTVKCRIGLDRVESFDFLDSFIQKVAQAGCRTFILHARTAILKGLSPKENREIPPLRYDLAEQVKNAHPNLCVILNGGVRTIQDIRAHLTRFDGVMIGREAYQNPWLLAEIESNIFGGSSQSRADIARAMIPYIESEARLYGAPPHATLRHMLGLFAGKPGARRWRQILGESALHPEISPAACMKSALKAVERVQPDPNDPLRPQDDASDDAP